jgi:hypothetical protein
MTKAVKAYEKRTNKALIHLLRQRNLKIIDLKQLFKCGENHVYNIIENHRIMTINEVLLLSATLDMPFVELVYLLHVNRKEVKGEDREVLSGLVEKYSKEQ